MTRNRIAAITAALALCAASIGWAAADADEPRGQRLDPAERLERMTARIEHKLGVDADTAAAVAEVLQAHGEAARAQRQALRDSGERPSREQRKALRTAHRDALAADLRGLLNEDQVRHVLTLVEQHRKGMRHRKRHHDAPQEG